MARMTPTTVHAHPLTAQEMAQLLHQLQQPAALLEILAVLLCLGGAWALVRFWRGHHTQVGGDSIWFGDHIVDGVLFPALALLMALGARRLLVEEIPLAVFRLAVPILLSLAVIRLTVKVLRAAFPKSTAVAAVEKTVSWGVWIGTVAWVTGVLPLVLDELNDITWKIGKSTLTLRNILEGVLSAILVLILSLSVSAAVERRLLKGATDNLSLRKIMANALRVIMLSVGLMMALSAAGVDLTALSVLGGAVGVGLGFGLQKLASNYISGFVILAERSLRIGDLVKVDNFEGRITDINTRYTVIRSDAGREANVPNEMLITQRVENASRADSKIMLTTKIQVVYGTDIEWLSPLLIKAVAAVPGIRDDPAPGVYLSAFTIDGIEITVSFWPTSPGEGDLAPRSRVNLAIVRCLASLNVDISFVPHGVLEAPPATTPHELSSDAT